MSGSFEIEVKRIANVQRQDLVSLLDDFIGDTSQVADRVGRRLRFLEIGLVA